MGKMEQDVRRTIRRSKIQRAILGTLVVAGVMSVLVLAPAAGQMLRLFDRGKRRTSNQKYAVDRAFWNLVDKGYIKLEDTPKGKRARLTAKGKQAVSVVEHPEFRVKKPKRWDKKWRILIFDIEEKRKRIRDQLRMTLRHIGFVQLQRSVWVYPYDCEDLIVLLKADFKIGNDVLYIIADRIENDKKLRNIFSLN